MSIKKKIPDEINTAWTKNGTILYKNKMEQIHIVKLEDFGHWLALPWPDRNRRQ